MPAGWYVTYPARAAVSKWGQQDGAFIQLDARAPYGGVAQHQVLRFLDAAQARPQFDLHLDEEFFSAHVINGWNTPPQLSYHSPIAQQFRIACADILTAVPEGHVRLCKAMAQYDEYISIFNTHIISGYMSYDDLGRILKAIDERMASYLGKVIPSSPSPP